MVSAHTRRQRVPRKLKKTWRPARPPRRTGQYWQIVDYVRTVIEQRTQVNDDTTADRLARGITTSVLHRLGYPYSQAVGSVPLGTQESTDG